MVSEISSILVSVDFNIKHKHNIKRSNEKVLIKNKKIKNMVVQPLPVMQPLGIAKSQNMLKWENK